MRLPLGLSALLSLSVLAACSDRPSPSDAVNAPADVRLTQAVSGSPTVNSVVNVTNDTTAQNETPLAVNPRNAQNLVTGNNDWKHRSRRCNSSRCCR